MKILFVTGMHSTIRMPNRGMIINRLASAVREQGHDVLFTAVGGERGPHRYLTARGVVANVVANAKPDLLHIHYGLTGLAVPRVKVPIVSSFYGDDLNGAWHPLLGTTLKSRLGLAVSQATAARSVRCVTVSASLKEKLWFREWRNKTVVIRDAVDPVVFQPRSRDEARRRLGIDVSEILVIFPHDVGQPNKRVWLAHAAVDAFKASKPNARLWVVNGKPADEMPWYYSAADVLLITSAREGGPSSAKEALACGLPVVSLAVGDLELFDDVPAAMVRAEGRPGDLAGALCRAIELGMGQRRSFLPPWLTLEAAARRMCEVYKAAVG